MSMTSEMKLPQAQKIQLPFDPQIRPLSEALHSYIYTQCREQLEVILDGYNANKFVTDKSHPTASIKKVGIKIERALKLLTCASIHLIGIEASDSVANSGWYLKLLFLALLAADAKCPDPGARAVIVKLGSFRQDVIAKMAAEEALLQLGVEDCQILNQLSSAILNGRVIRFEILKLALSGNKDILAQRTSSSFLEKLASTLH